MFSPVVILFISVGSHGNDGNGTEVRGIVSIARPLNLRAVLRRTQQELGGFPVAATAYFEKGLCLGRWRLSGDRLG